MCAPVVFLLQHACIQLPEVLCEGNQSECVQAKPEAVAAHLQMVHREALQVIRAGLHHIHHDVSQTIDASVLEGNTLLLLFLLLTFPKPPNQTDTAVSAAAFAVQHYLLHLTFTHH